MKLFGEVDTETLKQHFGKKIMALEDEKRAAQVCEFYLYYLLSPIPGGQLIYG